MVVLMRPLLSAASATLRQAAATGGVEVPTTLAAAQAMRRRSRKSKQDSTVVMTCRNGQCSHFHASPKREVVPIIVGAIGVALAASGIRYLLRVGRRMKELEDEERKKGRGSATDGAGGGASAGGVGHLGPAIGLDIGTTSMRLAFADGLEKGPEIVENREGMRWTPAAVYYQSGQDTLVGQLARANRWTHPAGTLYSTQGLLGAEFDSPTVQDIASSVKYGIKASEEGLAAIQADWVAAGAEGGGGTIMPEEVTAAMLKHMMDLAIFKVGSRGATMLTVPEYFTEQQRSLYETTALSAGLVVLGVLDTAAAAVSAAMETGSLPAKGGLFAVVDMGGRATSVSIVDAGEGGVRVVGNDWTAKAGGDLLEDELVKVMDRDFLKANVGANSLLQDQMALPRLYEAAEAAKMDLSKQASTAVNIPFITADMTGPKHLETTLSRAQLEQQMDPMLQRVAGPCEEALVRAGVSVDKLDGVLLVGGGSRVPAVQALAKRVFRPQQGLIIPLHSEELAVLGATLAARKVVYPAGDDSSEEEN